VAKPLWGPMAFASPVALVAVFALRPGTSGVPPARLADVRPARVEPVRASHAYRTDALRRATVWQTPPDRSVTALVSTPDPAHTFAASPLECRYQPEPAHGTTSKFNCILADGEVVKVKYGGTGEIQAEVAASRLLARIGFPADQMFIVPRVRCYGCPHLPFEVSWAADRLRIREPLMRWFPSTRYVDFTRTAVERRFPGAAVEADGAEGWAWYEFQEVDAPSAAAHAERDALRLVAMLLSHWDNKSANQRLVCLDGDDGSTERCARPLAMIHDLGATFGPNKVNLPAWIRAPIWSEASRCTLSMHQFPYGGGTFPDTRIGEAGRRLLLRELDTISEADTRAWFASAGFREVDSWTSAFREKIRQIREAGPCPDAVNDL
jgi:hypothetical protein